MLLSLRSLKRTYTLSRGLFGRPAAQVAALRGVSLDLSEGEVVGVVGESGCGKSTLARLAVGLEEPDGGQVFWGGRALKEMAPEERRRLRRDVQMVFQNPFASLDPRQRVGEALEEPLAVHGVGTPGERRAAVEKMLERVGLDAGDAHRYPHQFSGGQRQRVALARSLMLGPKALVLDEPLSNLDVSVQASVLNLLTDLNRETGTAYLFISHDLNVVAYLSRKVAVLYLGLVVEEGPTSGVLRRPLHPYTRALLSSSRTKKSGVAGDPPNPAMPPPGCSFHTRCPYAEDRCRKWSAELLPADENHQVACWKWQRIPLSGGRALEIVNGAAG